MGYPYSNFCLCAFLGPYNHPELGVSQTGSAKGAVHSQASIRRSLGSCSYVCILQKAYLWMYADTYLFIQRSCIDLSTYLSVRVCYRSAYICLPIQCIVCAEKQNRHAHLSTEWGNVLLALGGWILVFRISKITQTWAIRYQVNSMNKLFLLVHTYICMYNELVRLVPCLGKMSCPNP